jgi:hypothetical protein
VAGFGVRHGAPSLAAGPEHVRLTAPDGATADLEVPWPPLPAGPDADLDASVAALAGHAAAPRTALLVLVRRGGFAAGTAREGELLDSAVGTRYVQGRTAAGGWSQQRFARRRRGQAAQLVDAAADAVCRVLDRSTAPPEVVVPGGDARLVADVLQDPRLRPVASLPRGPVLPVPDPRLAVLQDAAQRCRAVRIRLEEG